MNLDFLKSEKCIKYLLLVILAIFLLYKNRKNIEGFGNYKTTCNQLPRAIKEVIEERKMKKVDGSAWDYFIPCGYTYCERDVRGFVNEKTGKKIFMIDGCDWLASKLGLWDVIKREYGKKAYKIMPQTFILNDKRDMFKFSRFFDRRKKKNEKCKFILKNYKQRQEGLRLADNMKDIKEGVKNDFKIVQDYIENPFIINTRKINLRYYLLVVCHHGKIGGWIYRDGFVYYTPKPFKKYSMDFNRNITTGYIDRKVYDENPLTLEDFRKHIGEEKAKLWDKEVNRKMNQVMKALSAEICSDSKLSKHIKFQIFGADVAPSDKLTATIMEINKGPDIGFKDEKDGNVKKNMIRGAFNIIEPLDDEKTGYVRIY